MLRDGTVTADGTPEEVVNRKNMEELYAMKLMVRENPLFHKPEIVPIRVMGEEQVGNPFHIHVICGASGAAKIMEELDARGYRVTAGVVNVGSDDWDICHFLDLERVEIDPFTPVTEEDQRRNLKLMEDADVILISDVPFGESNLKNLEGLESRRPIPSPACRSQWRTASRFLPAYGWNRRFRQIHKSLCPPGYAAEPHS